MAKLSNTDFEISTGTWAVEDSVGADKQITCKAAGVISMPSSQAFGTFECEVNKDLTANVLDVMFIADTRGGASAAGQDGYGIRFDSDETISLVSVANGTPTDEVSSSAQSLQTWVKVRVTRNTDGNFELFIDDVGVGTASETTVTSSSFLAPDLDTGDAIRNIKFSPTIIDPTA